MHGVTAQPVRHRAPRNWSKPTKGDLFQGSVPAWVEGNAFLSDDRSQKPFPVRFDAISQDTSLPSSGPLHVQAETQY
jgi:hypothetical protein